MSQDVTELFVAGIAGGRVWVAPAGTTMPTALGNPGTGWTDMGYLSEDGFAVAPEQDTEDIHVWPLLPAARTVTTGASTSFKLAFAQWNADTLGLYWGGTWADDGSVKRLKVPPNRAAARYSLIIDSADGDRTYRYALPLVDLSGFEEITHKLGEPSLLGCTMKPLAASADEWFSILTDDTAVVVAP